MTDTAGEMKASLVLTLEDRLTSGLEPLLDIFGKLDRTLQTLTGQLNGLFNKTMDEGADNATRKIGHVENSLKQLGETAQSVGGHFGAMWEKVSSAGEKIGALGAAGAGISIVEPVRAATEYENTLRHITITEKLSGAAVDEEIKRLTTMFADDAQRTGQSSESIAKAYSDLITTGIPKAILDRVIGAHSQAATAYNISPEALGPAVGALLQNFHIGEADIGSALSAMALAAKEGRFKVEDFSRELPGVSGFMSTLGMTEREGADISFAALETVMKNASNPGQAAADFTDALNYLTGNAAKLAFRKSGVDLPELLQAGEKVGKNPLDTILDKLAEMTKGQDPVKMAETLHGVLHNQQAEQALMALLQHREEFNTLKGSLDKVDPATVLRDFQTAFADPITQVRLFTENMAQLNRSVGEAFIPTLTHVTEGLGGLKSGFDYMNTNFPVLTKAIGDLTGGFLAIVAGLGAIGFVAPLVTAGATALVAALTVLATPGVLVAGAVALVGALAIVAAKNPAETLKRANEEHPENAGIQPGQTRMPGFGMPSETRRGGDDMKLHLHVTADPGLRVQTRSASQNLSLDSGDDPTLNQSVGRP